MKFSMRDAGIPVLTEVIEPALPPASGTDEPSAQAGPAPQEMTAAAHAALSKEDFNLLVDTVRESVVLQLQSHYEAVLGNRIEARLAETLEAAAVDIAAQIKGDILRELEALVGATSRQKTSALDFIKE